jgi:hypothetical protein
MINELKNNLKKKKIYYNKFKKEKLIYISKKKKN